MCVWGGGVGRDLLKGGLGGNSGFAFGKCVGLFSQTAELLCSSSLQGQTKKSGGKVPLTSFLQPHRGLRRGRARFPGKHRARLGGGGRLRPACGDAGRRAEDQPRTQAAGSPSLHPSSREQRLERPGCSRDCFKPRGKPATAGEQPGAPDPGRRARRTPPRPRAALPAPPRPARPAQPGPPQPRPRG